MKKLIKNLWWGGFTIITFASFLVSIFNPHREWYQGFFAWLITLIIWSIVLIYFSNKNRKIWDFFLKK